MISEDWRNRKIEDERNAFKASIGACMVCDDRWRNGPFPRCLEVHEISRGAARQRSLKVRASWLLLCRRHHELVSTFSVVRQLALKFLADPEWYDAAVVNELRKRSELAITDGDVLEELPFIRAVIAGDFG